MTLSGVRSYSDKIKQEIEFQTPQTIITGSNGCGKTSIIEALKFMLTNDAPGNIKEFIHDPRVAGKTAVHGNVVLNMLSKQKDEIQEVTKEIELSFRDGKLANKAKTGKIKRYVASTGVPQSENPNRSTEIQKCVQDYCGNPSVQSHVLFTNQEDYTWPLSGDKNVKERFSEIFDAVQFEEVVEGLAEALKQNKVEQGRQGKDFEDLESRNSRVFDAKKDRKEKMQAQTKVEEEQFGLKKEAENVEHKLQDLKKVREQHEEAAYHLQSISQFIGSQVNYIMNEEVSKHESKRQRREELSEDPVAYTLHLASVYENAGIQDLEYLYSSVLQVNSKQRDEHTELSQACQISEEIQKKTRALVEKGDLELNQLQNQQKLIEEQTQRNQDEQNSLQSQQQGAEYKEKEYTEDLAWLAQEVGAVSTVTDSRVQMCESVTILADNMILEMNNRVCHSKMSLDLQRDDCESSRQELTRMNEDRNRKRSAKEQQDEQYKEIVRNLAEIEGSLKQHIDLDARQTFLDFVSSVHTGGGDLSALLNGDIHLFRQQLQQQRDLASSGEVVVESAIERQIEILKMYEVPTPPPASSEDVVSKLDQERTKIEAKTRKIEDISGALEQKETQISELQARLTDLGSYTKVADLEDSSSLTEKLISYKQSVEEASQALYKAKAELEQGEKQRVSQLEELSQCRGAQHCEQSCVLPSLDSDATPHGLQKLLLETQQSLCADESRLELQKIGDGHAVTILQQRTAHECICGTQIEAPQRACLNAFFSSLVHNSEEIQQLAVRIERQKRDCSALERYVTAYSKLCEQNCQERAITVEKRSKEYATLKNMCDEITADVGEEQRIKKDLINLSKDAENYRSFLTEMPSKMELQSMLQDIDQKRLVLQEELKQCEEYRKLCVVMERNRVETLSVCVQGLQRCKDSQATLRQRQDDQQGVQASRTQVQDQQMLIQNELNQCEVNWKDLFDKIPMKEKLVEESHSRWSSLYTQTEQKITTIYDRLKRCQLRAVELDGLGEVPAKLTAQNAALASQRLEQSELKAKHEKQRVEYAAHKLVLEEETNKCNCSTRRLKQVDDCLRLLESINAWYGWMSHSATQGEYRQEWSTSMENRRMELSNSCGRCETRIEERNVDIQRIDKTQQELNHQEVENDFEMCRRRIKTHELMKQDLELLHQRHISALNLYYKEKLAAVNETQNELWQVVYQGKDVESIYIKGKVEQASTAGTRRKYQYQVMMRAAGCDLEMRGRCSAGQKMLACLLVRLALNEHFGSSIRAIALDEPTAHMDAEHTDKFAEALENLIERRRSDNFQVVLITHDTNLAERLAMKTNTRAYYIVSKEDNGYSQIGKVTL